MFKNWNEITSALEDFNFKVMFQNETSTDKRMVLYGFSEIARLMVDAIGSKILFICDKTVGNEGFEYKGVKVLPPDELRKHVDINIFITDFEHLFETKQQFEEAGIPLSTPFAKLFQNIFPSKAFLKIKMFEKRVILTAHEIQQLFFIANKITLKDRLNLDEKSEEVLFELCNMIVWKILGKLPKTIVSPNQYFPNEILASLTQNESFCDVGAWPGNTIDGFLFHTQNQFEAIYAFEMDRANFSILQSYINSLQLPIKNKIHLFNIGLWNEKSELRYSPNFGATAVTPLGTEFSPAGKLDDLIDGRVTFIKMDIEGAEMKALEGASQIITSQRPKLAIACYHSHRGGLYTGSSDLFDIPAYIKSLVPEYKIFIRHHYEDKNCLETVCYAVPHKT